MSTAAKPCDSFAQNLTLFAADLLAHDERAPVEAHLDCCAACRKQLHELQMTVRPLQNWQSSLMNVEVTAAQRERWNVQIKSPRKETAGVSPLVWFWTELIAPYRLTWSALFVAWLLMAGLNWEQSITQAPVALVKDQNRHPHESLLDDQRLLAELINSPAVKPSGPSQHHSPRSESDNGVKIC